jgi:hypothetical protein
MSNHSGGRMLNDVIGILEKSDVFKLLGQDKSRAMVLEIVKVACWQYDCNGDEILEGVGEQVGICYCCAEPATTFRKGLCEKCDWE